MKTLKNKLTPEEVAKALRESNGICYDEAGILVSIDDELYRLEDCGEYVRVPKELKRWI